MIFDAEKIAEQSDGEVNYQLFQIENFYVEAKTSLEGKFRRTITTYSLVDLPGAYVTEVLKLPFVLGEEVSVAADKRIMSGKYVSNSSAA